MHYTLIKMNDNVTDLAERLVALRDRCVTMLSELDSGLEPNQLGDLLSQKV